jgi:hypothetical protein
VDVVVATSLACVSFGQPIARVALIIFRCLGRLLFKGPSPKRCVALSFLGRASASFPEQSLRSSLFARDPLQLRLSSNHPVRCCLSMTNPGGGPPRGERFSDHFIWLRRIEGRRYRFERLRRVEGRNVGRSWPHRAGSAGPLVVHGAASTWRSGTEAATLGQGRVFLSTRFWRPRRIRRAEYAGRNS